MNTNNQHFVSMVKKIRSKSKIPSPDIATEIGYTDRYFSELLNTKIEDSPWEKTFKLIDYLIEKSDKKVTYLDFIPTIYKDRRKRLVAERDKLNEEKVLLITQNSDLKKTIEQRALESARLHDEIEKLRKQVSYYKNK